MKKSTDQKVEPPAESPVARRRFPLWVIIVSISLLILAILGVGRHSYLGWKERRLVRAARFFLGAGKPQELRLTLDGVLALNPNNIEAFRISGQARLKQGDAKALPWLRRVVELAPESVDDQIILADSALRFGQNQEAEKVIRDVEPKARGRADFQDIAGRAIQSKGQIAEAEAHYAEAVRLAPDNHTYRLHLAVTRLNSQDPAIREKARAEAEQLSSEAPLRAEALRALVLDAVKYMQTIRAVSLASDLNSTPGRFFSDRLMYLEVLHLVKSPDFHLRLVETQQEAERNDQILAMLFWMNGNNLSVLAKDWAQRLPPALVSTAAIRLEIARSYAAFGDWKKLRFFLADEKWGDLDFMRRAMLSRCYRELENSPTNSKATWAEAINTAGNKGDALLALARLAMEWGWDSEASDALWQAVTKSNRSTEALNGLCQLYFSKRDTAGLYRAYALLLDRNPSDANTRNNVVIFSLLLDKDKNRAETTAAELHAKEPGNPVYASTYAFALYCAGKNKQALEVMNAMKPAELKDPSVAAYYSAILEKAGLTGKAQEYRELARNATLLPEEERILNLAPAKSAPTATE